MKARVGVELIPGEKLFRPTNLPWNVTWSPWRESPNLVIESYFWFGEQGQKGSHRIACAIPLHEYYEYSHKECAQLFAMHFEIALMSLIDHVEDHLWHPENHSGNTIFSLLETAIRDKV